VKYYVQFASPRGVVGRRPRDPIEVEVEADRAMVGGVAADVHFAAIPGTPLYHLSIGGESWTVAVQPGEGSGRWILGIVGERIEVEVVDESTKRMQELAARRPVKSGPETIHAPMPGLIVRIPATVGQAVGAGESLVVVEAMKMESELRAPRAGVVATVHVKVGEAVERGAPLVTLSGAPAET
jgi:acetyl/propionyl-CoA carboxylase alpha subunit